MSAGWWDWVLALAALPVAGAAAYLGLLAALARRSPVQPSRSASVPLAVVVPAHDEEAGIADTVRSLLAVDYPREAFEVVVVADNCSDRTAEVAGAAGARVLERRDPERRGKGHALNFAFERLLGEGRAEAIVVVDADSVVTPNLLAACATRLAGGASALQAHYAVRNASESWRTRLMAIAFEAFHGVRSLARERLGLSSGLRGNGMAFSAALLREVPHQAFSIVEDLEYGIRLAYAGHRVHYVAEATVYGQMPATSASARSQRQRWEVGRQGIARAHAPRLLRRAWRERSPLLLDLALDLLVPPVSTLALACAVGLGACALAIAAGAPLGIAPWLWGLSAAGLGAYVLRGWALSGLGPRGLLDLMAAPAYMAWRLLLRRDRGAARSGEWVRTDRDPPRS